jgi:glutaredoxin 3
MSKWKDTGKRALQTVFAGLNRADEIGGEIRDYIQDRVLVDERYVRARRRLAELRGGTYVSRNERDALKADRARAAAAAAPPPAATVTKEVKGLGDTGLPAQVYGRTSCPWTGRSIRLLEDLKVDYDYIDLDDADNGHHQPQLVAETKQNTVPYIYLRGQFIGGFNALSEIQRAGQLDYLLLSSEDREHANPVLKKISITPRPNTDEAAPGEA